MNHSNFVRTFFFCVLLTMCLSAWSRAQTAWVKTTTAYRITKKHKTPQFRDYPVHSIYRGKTAPLDPIYKSAASRSGLHEAAKSKAGFAGHYIVVEGSCGSCCKSIGAMDAKTGRVVWLQPTLDFYNNPAVFYKGALPVDYRRTSKLMILHGKRDQKQDDSNTHYYKFEHDQFVHITSF